jgi:hypothetical protein
MAQQLTPPSQKLVLLLHNNSAVATMYYGKSSFSWISLLPSI